MVRLEINQNKAKLKDYLPFLVISDRILSPRVHPHRMCSFLQRANAARDEILHHVPSGEPLFLQVFDGLNVGGNPAKILASRIARRNLLGSLPNKGKAVFTGRLPIEPLLLPPRPRRPGEHLNVLLGLPIMEL